jgi:hypothetical protein
MDLVLAWLVLNDGRERICWASSHPQKYAMTHIHANYPSWLLSKVRDILSTRQGTEQTEFSQCVFYSDIDDVWMELDIPWNSVSKDRSFQGTNHSGWCRIVSDRVFHTQIFADFYRLCTFLPVVSHCFMYSIRVCNIHPFVFRTNFFFASG